MQFAICNLQFCSAAADTAFPSKRLPKFKRLTDVNYVNATCRRWRKFTNIRILLHANSDAKHDEHCIKDCKRKSPLSAVNTEESNDGGRWQVALRFLAHALGFAALLAKNSCVPLVASGKAERE